MNNNSKISNLSIKCHSSKQLFCRGDICFIEYDELKPKKTEYGCIVLDKTIDDKCNKTIDFIHRECCSTTFCNSRLFNYDIYHHRNHRWSISNFSSINDNDRFHTRLLIILNMVMAILLFSLFCAIVIYLWKQRIKRVCKNLRQRTIRSRKLQPAIPMPSFINGDNIIHMSPSSPSSPFSAEDYPNNPPPPTLIFSNNSKPSEII